LQVRSNTDGLAPLEDLTTNHRSPSFHPTQTRSTRRQWKCTQRPSTSIPPLQPTTPIGPSRILS
jgi:hypothetical protein